MKIPAIPPITSGTHPAESSNVTRLNNNFASSSSVVKQYKRKRTSGIGSVAHSPTKGSPVANTWLLVRRARDKLLRSEPHTKELIMDMLTALRTTRQEIVISQTLTVRPIIGTLTSTEVPTTRGKLSI